MEYEIQTASGIFYLLMGDGFVQRYDGIQNIVVKLSNRNNETNETSSTPAILVNAHFDSVPQVSSIYMLICWT